MSSAIQADEGVSLDAQRDRLKAYANLYDLELIEVAEDAGLSAKSLARPGLHRVLAGLEAGLADGVLVTKLDRLTRSVRDLGDLVEQFFAPGRFALLSVAENVDTRTAGGRLVLNVLGAVSQWEREAVGERTREAMAHLKAQGVRMGAPGLGWRYASQPDASGRRPSEGIEAERAAVVRILELSKTGLSARAMAKRMTAEGWPTKRGGLWHKTTIQRVLRRAERGTP